MNFNEKIYIRTEQLPYGNNHFYRVEAKPTTTIDEIFNFCRDNKVDLEGIASYGNGNPGTPFIIFSDYISIGD